MIQITEPCGKHFGEMPGDERRRFCSTCGTHVYNAAAFPDAELAGRCLYIGGETAAPQSRRAVMAGLVLTTISPLLAQNGRVRITVIDASGAAVSGAEVSIGEWRGKTDGLGDASMSGLPVGRFPVRVSSPGFKVWAGAVNVGNDGESKVAVALEVGSVGGSSAIVHLTGSVTVTVFDPSGGAVLRGTVSGECADGKVRKAVWAGRAAAIGDVPPGDCRVTVKVPGFRVWAEQLTVGEGQSATVKAQLELEAAEEKIAVKPVGPLGRFKNWLTSCTTRR